MGLPQTPSPPHLYPQALQLKLYQAFIFSIPILFSIILFLLFYLFYLKRRASSLSSPPPPIIPRGLSQATPFIHTSCDLMDLKGELKEKLPIVLFDEDLRARDSQCCVCLGDFEIKEELLQVPLCKHVFHIDCIHHWLCSNSTCPLCRCSIIIPTTKLGNPEPAPSAPQRPQQDNDNSNQHPQIVPLEQQRQQLQQQQQQQQQQQVIQIEGSSSASTCLRDSGRFSMLSISMENEMGCPDQESVVLHIQMHNS